MQRHKKLSARILSMALTVAMVATMMPVTVFAAEGGSVAPGASSIGTIQSFDKLEDRFEPSTGEGASKDVYALNVELNTPFEDLNLPDELTAMVARTTTVSKPAEDEPAQDSGKPSEPAEDEVIPDEDKVVDEDTATDDTVSGNQPASPSDAEENAEIPDEDVPLAPEPDEETTVTTTEQETIPVTWNSDKEYQSDENGQFIYTAELPEGYILADGVKLPQIYVAVGKQARATGDAITVTITGTSYGGTSLQNAVGKLPAGTTATSLKITAGEVTTADWSYLESLSAMTTFEIADDVAVTSVANIPAGTSSASIFPKSIVTVTVPQAITIGENAFKSCTALTDVSFPAVTSIGDYAFFQCSALTDASFPEVTSIDDYAFYVCGALTSASFPKVTSIGHSAFRTCGALTSASFPNATSISDEAFYACGVLTNTSFPKVSSIGAKAFFSCTVLATLKLGATAPTTVGTDAFKNCPATRALGYVDADGNDLAGDALTNAQDAYKGVITSGAVVDGKWYGWTIETVASGGEQFNLPLGGTYYFDLSGEAGTITSGVSDKIGTINTNLPDATMHYVPFTYVGTVNAYSLDSSSSGNTSASTKATPSDRSLFVADYVVSNSVNWDSLNTNNFIFGKTLNADYQLRSLSAGNIAYPTITPANEWDTILDKTTVTNPIKNWSEAFTWGQDTKQDNNASRAIRSLGSARYWGGFTSSKFSSNLGFRPVLEVLNPTTLTADGLNAVELDWNGGKFNNSTDSIKIVCAGDTFIAPGSTGLTAPTGKTAKATFWNTVADGSGTSYAAGASVPKTVTKLYAQWGDLITVGGTNATEGYETANAATLQKAFTSIADNGTISWALTSTTSMTV